MTPYCYDELPAMLLMTAIALVATAIYAYRHRNDAFKRYEQARLAYSNERMNRIRNLEF